MFKQTRKSMQVHASLTTNLLVDLRTEVSASHRKSFGQTKRKLNASRKLALIGVDLRVRLARA